NLDGRNPFLLDNVCDGCNHSAGKHVDLPFARGWLFSIDRTHCISDYQVIDEKAKIPLRHMGSLDEVAPVGLVCDFWFGPAGDLIYHFHKPFPDNLKGLSVSNIRAYRNDMDPGFVFVFLGSNNPVWQRVTARAIWKSFKLAEVHAPQFERIDEDSWLKVVPKERLPLVDKLRKLKVHNSRSSIDLNAEPRFLCKLTLGMGELFLKPNFKKSAEAEMFRKGMWAQGLKKREELDIRGSGWTDRGGQNDDLGQMLSWRYGHSIGLIALPHQGVALFSSFYGKRTSIMRISDHQNFWKSELEEGVFYLLCPAIRKCLGPYRYIDFLFHNYGNRKIQELEDFEQSLNSIKENQPPRQI
ncbi:MAG: hypothetical protein ACPGD8_01840, partial [Flavobacteriales bacterium]